MNTITRLRRTNLLCCHFARNLAYYKAGWDTHTPKFTNEFWATVNGNFLDICVLEWCKLFGNRNDGHYWQQVVDDKEKFRKDMFNALSIKQSDLDSYWSEIKDYRDEFVAHLLSKETMNIPNLQLAWATVEYYNKYIVQTNINPEATRGLPQVLKDYYDKCFTDAINEYK